MWFRFMVAGAFSFLGFLAILWGTRIGVESPEGAVWLNVGTEVIGIAITVAIVDALFELTRRQAEARALARRILGELDYAVWVWQGGRRDSSLFELRGLLRSIQATDPIAPCTAELLFSLGCEAQGALSWQEDVVKVNRHLHVALNKLEFLTALRDSDRRFSVEMIQSRLHSATVDLAHAAGLNTNWSSRRPEVELRDSSVDQQMRRRFGQPVPSVRAGLLAGH